MTAAAATGPSESKGSSRPLVSVVTPVYNGAEYLAECVESVLRQTYDNWEYVIADNCSTDGTLELAHGYAERDPRIRVVAAETFAATSGENANRALREISPESAYCKVVHADDWLYPECLEKMVALAEANPSVGVVSAYRLDGRRVTLKGLPPRVTVVPGPEISRRMLLGEMRYLFGSPTSVLMRADLVRVRPEFYNLDNPFQDDQEACYELLRQSDFGFVHQVLTFSRRHEGAETTTFARVGAQVPGQLGLLLKFGPVYLSPHEYERRLAVVLAAYLVFLARRLRRLVRDPGFRAYQARELASLRSSLSLAMIARGVARQIRRLWVRRGSGTRDFLRRTGRP